MWQSVPLTLFWFTYMGSLGVFFPYFSLYLKENAGLSASEVGIVLAILPLVGIVAQPAWGRIADRTGARSGIVALLSVVSSLAYLLLGWAHGFLAIVAATALLALFSTAVLPMTTSISFGVLRRAGLHAFGYVRVWGTLGYFVVVLVFPSVMERYVSTHEPHEIDAASPAGLWMMFPFTAAVVLAAAVIAFFLPRVGAVALRAAAGDWRELTRSRTYLRLLFFSLLANLLVYGPMWLFPVLVRSRGGDVASIRMMWIVMLTFEIPLVLATGRGLRHLGPRGILSAGMLAGGLRWLICAYAGELTSLYPVQALHGVTVVGLTLGAPLYLDHFVPEKLRSTAQGTLAMVTGIAGVLSNIASGWLIERDGIDALYWLAGGGCIAVGIFAGMLLPSVGNRKPGAAAAEDRLEKILPSDI